MTESQPAPPKSLTARHPVLRYLLLFLGLLFLGAGFIGIYLPGLPTVPFWIVAAFCFSRSSPRLRQYIYNFPKIGPTVDRFLTDGSLSLKAKKAASSGIAFSACLCSILWYFNLLPGWSLLLALAGMSLGLLYVLTRPLTGSVPSSS